MVKKNWTVPFTVRLNKFIFERHPGVTMARNYESRITRIEDGSERSLEIKMNEPMRYAGFTFFQESYGPANAGPNDAMYSQFAVANNPADQWPLWALVINGIGLAIHFVASLIDHTKRSRRNAAGAVPATSAA
jgi:cytochrome c biogenesis protein ResB